jgi:MFS family permease
VVAWGGALAVLGLLVVLVSPFALLAVGGFFLVGLGAANLVPVLFSAAGRQTTMAPALAVAAVTSAGYAGILAGPPLLGFIAHAAGLNAAFWLVTALLAAALAFGGGAVSRPSPRS